MSNIKKLLTLFIIIALMGCGDGSYDFKTVATYYASTSNLNVDLITIGHVMPGDDLGDGLVKAKITSSKFTDTIYLQSSATLLKSLIYKKETITIIKPYDIFLSLKHCLDTIGYSDYEIPELKEFGEAIEFTAYGPKGTYLKGQTEFIEVLHMDYTTY